MPTPQKVLRSPQSSHRQLRLIMEELSVQVGNYWTDSSPSVLSLYQHSRVPALKPQACITCSQ